MNGLQTERDRRLWTEKLGQICQYFLEQYSSPDTNPALYTPYQFSLPLLQALYYQLENYGEDVELATIRGVNGLRAINPGDRANALKRSNSVRAIAYYSWEAETRLFLVRRIFPTYFDFLGVSHIPEGWGASSYMLVELRQKLKDKTTIKNGSFYTVFDAKADIKNLRYALPYMAEQARLNYDRIVVLPVFKNGTYPSDEHILGAFLFFVAGRDLISGTDEGGKIRLENFFQPLCSSMSSIVEAHNAKLIFVPGSSDSAGSPVLDLPGSWRKERANLAQEVGIVEISFQCHRPDGHVMKNAKY